jgi:hypothetical protein
MSPEDVSKCVWGFCVLEEEQNNIYNILKIK